MNRDCSAFLSRFRGWSRSISRKKRGLGDCPQGVDFDFDYYLLRAPSPKAVFPRFWLLRENRAGASLGPGLFAVFAKRPGHIAGG